MCIAHQNSELSKTIYFLNLTFGIYIIRGKLSKRGKMWKIELDPRARGVGAVTNLPNLFANQLPLERIHAHAWRKQVPVPKNSSAYMFTFPISDHLMVPQRTVFFFNVIIYVRSRAYVYIIYEKTKGKFPWEHLLSELGKQNIQAEKVYYGVTCNQVVLFVSNSGFLVTE